MSLQELLARWPYRVGASPFHIKGVSYIAQQKVFGRMFPGGLDALLAALEKKSPELAEFFGARFLASQFYDVFPLPAVSCQIAPLIGKTPEDFIAEASAEQARDDLGGIYRILLRVTSTSQLVERMPMLVNRYYDFAPMSVVSRDDSSAHLLRQDFPTILDPWSNPTNIGYGSAALQLGGAQGVRIEMETVPNGKTRDSLALGDVHVRVTWR